MSQRTKSLPNFGLWQPSTARRRTQSGRQEFEQSALHDETVLTLTQWRDLNSDSSISWCADTGLAQTNKDAPSDDHELLPGALRMEGELHAIQHHPRDTSNAAKSRGHREHEREVRRRHSSEPPSLRTTKTKHAAPPTAYHAAMNTNQRQRATIDSSRRSEEVNSKSCQEGTTQMDDFTDVILPTISLTENVNTISDQSTARDFGVVCVPKKGLPFESTLAVENDVYLGKRGSEEAFIGKRSVEEAFFSLKGSEDAYHRKRCSEETYSGKQDSTQAQTQVIKKKNYPGGEKSTLAPANDLEDRRENMTLRTHVLDVQTDHSDTSFGVLEDGMVDTAPSACRTTERNMDKGLSVERIEDHCVDIEHFLEIVGKGHALDSSQTEGYSLPPQSESSIEAFSFDDRGSDEDHPRIMRDEMIFDQPAAYEARLDTLVSDDNAITEKADHFIYENVTSTTITHMEASDHASLDVSTNPPMTKETESEMCSSKTQAGLGAKSHFSREAFLFRYRRSFENNQNVKKDELIFDSSEKNQEARRDHVGYGSLGNVLDDRDDVSLKDDSTITENPQTEVSGHVSESTTRHPSSTQQSEVGLRSSQKDVRPGQELTCEESQALNDTDPSLLNDEMIFESSYCGERKVSIDNFESQPNTAYEHPTNRVDVNENPSCISDDKTAAKEDENITMDNPSCIFDDQSVDDEYENIENESPLCRIDGNISASEDKQTATSPHTSESESHFRQAKCNTNEENENDELERSMPDKERLPLEHVTSSENPPKTTTEESVLHPPVLSNRKIDPEKESDSKSKPRTNAAFHEKESSTRDKHHKYEVNQPGDVPIQPFWKPPKSKADNTRRQQQDESSKKSFSPLKNCETITVKETALERENEGGYSPAIATANETVPIEKAKLFFDTNIRTSDVQSLTANTPKATALTQVSQIESQEIPECNVRGSCSSTTSRIENPEIPDFGGMRSFQPTKYPSQKPGSPGYVGPNRLDSIKSHSEQQGIPIYGDTGPLQPIVAPANKTVRHAFGTVASFHPSKPNTDIPQIPSFGGMGAFQLIQSRVENNYSRKYQAQSQEKNSFRERFLMNYVLSGGIEPKIIKDEMIFEPPGRGHLVGLDKNDNVQNETARGLPEITSAGGLPETTSGLAGNQPNVMNDKNSSVESTPQQPVAVSSTTADNIKPIEDLNVKSEDQTSTRQKLLMKPVPPNDSEQCTLRQKMGLPPLTNSDKQVTDSEESSGPKRLADSIFGVDAKPSTEFQKVPADDESFALGDTVRLPENIFDIGNPVLSITQLLNAECPMKPTSPIPYQNDKTDTIGAEEYHGTPPIIGVLDQKEQDLEQSSSVPVTEPICALDEEPPQETKVYKKKKKSRVVRRGVVITKGNYWKVSGRQSKMSKHKHFMDNSTLATKSHRMPVGVKPLLHGSSGQIFYEKADDGKYLCKGIRRKNALMSQAQNVNFNSGEIKPNTEAKASAFIGEYLFELWKNQCLCDVKIQSPGGAFLAHKIVLAAFSDVFCPVEPQPCPSLCVDVTNTTGDAVYQVLLYLYTSEMELSDDTLEEVLNAALYLGVSDVVELIKEILQNPTKDNFMKYLEIATRSHLSISLMDMPHLFRDNLHELWDSEPFKILTVDDMIRVLKDPEVLMNAESDSLEAVCKWAEYCLPERIPDVINLLQYVNFVCIDPKMVCRIVEKYEHIFDHKDMQHVLAHIFKSFAVNSEVKKLTTPGMSNPDEKPGGGKMTTSYGNSSMDSNLEENVYTKCIKSCKGNNKEPRSVRSFLRESGTDGNKVYCCPGQENNTDCVATKYMPCNDTEDMEKTKNATKETIKSINEQFQRFFGSNRMSNFKELHKHRQGRGCCARPGSPAASDIKKEEMTPGSLCRKPSLPPSTMSAGGMGGVSSSDDKPPPFPRMCMKAAIRTSDTGVNNDKPFQSSLTRRCLRDFQGDEKGPGTHSGSFGGTKSMLKPQSQPQSTGGAACLDYKNRSFSSSPSSGLNSAPTNARKLTLSTRQANKWPGQCDSTTANSYNDMSRSNCVYQDGGERKSSCSPSGRRIRFECDGP